MRLTTSCRVEVLGQNRRSAWGESPPTIVMLEISSAWNTRSRKRRHVGSSTSPNMDRLCRRISPGEGKEMDRSKVFIRWRLARTRMDE